MFYKSLIINILCVFSFLANAQKNSPDTLKPASPMAIPAVLDSSKIVADSTVLGIKKHRQKVNIFNEKFAADGIFTAGNVNRSLFQFSTNFDCNLHKKIKISTSPSFIYGTQNSVLTEREYFADLRASFFTKHQLYYLAFGTFEKSNLRQINYRWIVAAGLGFKIIENKNVYIGITNVLLYENTDFISDALRDRNLWRNSTRISGEYHFDKDKMLLKHTIFLQPSITEDNFRWNGSISLAYKISKSISLRTTLENSYESLVVVGKKNDDVRFTIGFVYEKSN